MYEYMCIECGPFTEIRSMSGWSDPTDCPECGRRSERTISAPQILNMNPHNRIAHQRNERSAEEPRMVTKKQHDHAACGHGHAHKHPGSAHKHGPSRPWMIGH
ncbi:MAG: FmdB family zinc ribbon protein [Hyphomicrobiales bacterium]